MTTKKHLKRRARSLAASTGQPYATALRRIRSQQEDRMSSSPVPTADSVALCSFCSKPEPAVQWLVAGPGGVFICDDCVDVSAKIITESGTEESARSRAAYLDPSVDITLTRIGELVRTADRVESQLVSSVNRLRERGTDWITIAAAAGIGAESIQARLERSERPTSP